MRIAVMATGGVGGYFGAKLTDLSDKQARYIGVDRDGPYKPDSYRY